jgi:hypothetical protein
MWHTSSGAIDPKKPTPQNNFKLTHKPYDWLSFQSLAFHGLNVVDFT